MQLDPHASRFLKMIAAGANAAPASLADRRRGFATLLRQAGPARTLVTTQDLQLTHGSGAVPARLYSPPDAEGQPLPGLLFFHGGGLVCGDLDTHDGLCGLLARNAGCRVVSVAYRLAPEHPFPAALDDGNTAAAALVESGPSLGLDRGRLAIGGDSAGAGLAAAVCQSSIRDDRSPFRVQLLMCPVLDAVDAGGSRQSFAEGYFLDRATIARDIAAYVGSATIDLADPQLSPLRAPALERMPPAIIHTAEFDPVLDDGAQFAARLAEAGVPVRYTCHPGMVHLFYALGGLIPSAATALAAMGAELRAALG